MLKKEFLIIPEIGQKRSEIPESDLKKLNIMSCDFKNFFFNFNLSCFRAFNLLRFKNWEIEKRKAKAQLFE